MPTSKSKGKKVESHFQKALLYSPVKTIGFKKGYKRRYGLELELEGAGFPMPPDGWTDHPDPSLRNGTEYILSSPHDFSGLANRIKALNAAFAANGTRINNSYRAGTHVHVNIQHELWSTILGMIILEAVIEPVLLRLCGAARNGSYFCLPTYDTGDLAVYFEDLLDTIEAGVPPRSNRGKYACMNTDPISTFGTLEFRCFPASHDEDQILTWVSWIENMLEMVKAQKDTSFWEMYMSFKHNGDELLRKIFPNINLNAVCAPETTQELTALGLETGYELTRLIRRKLKAAKEKKTIAYEPGAVNWGQLAAQGLQEVQEWNDPPRQAPFPVAGGTGGGGGAGVMNRFTIPRRVRGAT